LEGFHRYAYPSERLRGEKRKRVLRYALIVGLLLSLLTVGISCTNTPTPVPTPTPTPVPTLTPADPLSLCDENHPPLTNVELANLVIRYFPDGIVSQTGDNIRVTAYAVARAESGGNPSACGDLDSFAPGTASIGLWQINTYWNPKYNVVRLFDPEYNAQAAVECSNNGTNWTDWCTFESNACGGEGNRAYKAYLVEATFALAFQLYHHPNLIGR